MIGLIVGILGYVFSGSEIFGASLISSLDWVNTWYWIIASIVGIISLVLMLAGTIGGAGLGSDLSGSNKGIIGGAIGGALLGGLAAALLMAKSVIILSLSYYLMDSIDPSIQGFGELSANQGLAFGAMIVLMIFPSRSSSSKE